MQQEEYRFWLANLPGIGIKKIELLLQIYGCAEEVFRSTREELMTLREDAAFALRVSEKDVEMLLWNRNVEKIQTAYAKLRNNGIYFVSREEDQYPEKLRDIYDAPYALYVKGKLPGKEEKSLAIIGARDCSPYGIEMAKYLAGAIAKENISIISGLARGIDSYAHEGALTVGGTTYGILGCGIDICYPKENLKLYMAMQQGGGIISEYAPGGKPLAGNFPMRNRIISALSDGILVIEAREKSGSLITVDFGLEHGKEIYALPGRATDKLSEGCNNIIRMGAKLVTTPKDILEDFILNYEQNMDEMKKNNKLLENEEKIVYASLCLEPKHIEEVAVLTDLPLTVLTEKLLLLELRGFIRQTRKNYYVVI